MSDQINVVPSVLLDSEILAIGAMHGRPSVALLPMFRAFEAAVLSKLRAPKPLGDRCHHCGWMDWVSQDGAAYCQACSKPHGSVPAEGLPNLPQLLRENADLDAAEGGNPDVLALEWAAADEIERLRREVAKLRAPVADERTAFNKCHSAIIKALSSIARADGPDTRKADDPELLYRSPVMDDVVHIRIALDECRAALASAPVADLRPHLEWALRRIGTSLDTGDKYEAAQAALDAAKAAPQASASDFAKLQSAYVGACDQIAELLAEKQASTENAPVAGEAQPAAYLTLDEEGSPCMLFFDVGEARGYCAPGEEPEPLFRHAAPQASCEPLVRYCPGCGSVGPVGDEYRDCCPDGGEARTIPAPLAEKCRDTFKIAVKALRADAAANEAMANLVPAVTEEYTLRAMARNYTDRHSWDKLDSKAVTAAADEIRALRAALAARAQLPENGDAHG